MRPPTIAGLLVIVVAAIVITGVWLTGGQADPIEEGTATPESTSDGPRATVALTSNLYGSPSQTGELVAIIPEGREVRVTGRTDDSTWLRVIYPVASTLEGWLQADHLVETSLPELAAIPDVASTTGGGDGPGGGLLDEPALPDLTVSSADVGPTGALTVRITNVGRQAFSGTVGLRVTTAEGEIVGVLDVDLTASELGAGRSASVNTGVIVTETGLFVIEVDPDNEVEEASEFDNARRVLLVGTGE